MNVGCFSNRENVPKSVFNDFGVFHGVNCGSFLEHFRMTSGVLFLAGLLDRFGIASCWSNFGIVSGVVLEYRLKYLQFLSLLSCFWNLFLVGAA